MSVLNQEVETSTLLAQPRQVSDGTSNGDGFNVGNLAEDFKIQEVTSPCRAVV